MKVLITKEAYDLISASGSSGPVLDMVSNALAFEKKISYRKGHALSKMDGYQYSIICLADRSLSICYWAREEKLLLFCPPQDRKLLTTAFLQANLAESTEMLLS